MLLAAIDEQVNTGRQEVLRGNDPEPFAKEAARLTLRLIALQKEIDFDYD